MIHDQADLLGAEVEPNEDVYVSVKVKNVGNIPGNYEVLLVFDNSLYESEQVTLDVGATTQVDFTITPEEIGTHSISIGNQFEVIQVKEPQGGGLQIPTLLIDFGIVVVVVGIIYLLRQKNII